MIIRSVPSAPDICNVNPVCRQAGQRSAAELRIQIIRILAKQSVVDKSTRVSNNEESMGGEIFKKIYSFLFDTIQTILIAASVFLVIYIFFMRPFEVSGDSMYPTYENGEYILTNLISLRFTDPKQGDVIVFKAPEDEGKDYIKRVIAVPGDSVQVENNKVYINGSLFDESEYLSGTVQTPSGQKLKEGETLTVPDGSYIVMGDNRPHSSDSREWGFLPKEDVIGKSFFVYWPPNNMRIIKNPFIN